MPRKAEDITHVRISRDEKNLIDGLKYKDETTRSVLSRILEDYNFKGLRRKITSIVSDLQLITSHNIHQDFHSSFELLKAIIFMSEDAKDQFIRADICQKLNESLEKVLGFNYEKGIMKKPSKR